MATISGNIYFDRDRSATLSPGDAPLPGVAVVLQHAQSAKKLAVLTDATGAFSFYNVPAGSYHLIQAYGLANAVASPGNFAAALPGPIAVAAFPPLSLAPNPPASANHLDSVTPATLRLSVNDINLCHQNFFDGPVIYTPIETDLDSCVSIASENLITAADGGTLGTFPAGTPANTGAPSAPYPAVTPDFSYVLPNPAQYTPADGEYTVQNIMNNALNTVLGTWWRIADHTTGTETGRFMIINGSSPGAVFFRTQIAVKPHTSYLLTAWILNLIKLEGYLDPQLGVRVLDENGHVLYSSPLGTLIPVSPLIPEWKQIGSVIQTQEHALLTLEFLSEGAAASGNDYAIDDIAFQEVKLPSFRLIKSADHTSVRIGERIQYTLLLENTCRTPLTHVFFQDALPSGLSFVTGSVSVDGVSLPELDPIIGFATADIPGGQSLCISFSAVAVWVPMPNPIFNEAQLQYRYTPVMGGIPADFTLHSNAVPVEVLGDTDISVCKTALSAYACPDKPLTYRIVVTNGGPSAAENVLVYDAVPAAEVSLDEGATWQPWENPFSLGTLADAENRTLLLRQQLGTDICGHVSNTAVVTSTTPDPQPGNNTSSATVPVAAAGIDLCLALSACPDPVCCGQPLTISLAVRNVGPDAAQPVTIRAVLPPQLHHLAYSADGGATWHEWRGRYVLDALQADASFTLLISGHACRSGRVRIDASVHSPLPESSPGNNHASLFVRICP